MANSMATVCVLYMAVRAGHCAVGAKHLESSPF